MASRKGAGHSTAVRMGISVTLSELRSANKRSSASAKGLVSKSVRGEEGRTPGSPSSSSEAHEKRRDFIWRTSNAGRHAIVAAAIPRHRTTTKAAGEDEADPVLSSCASLQNLRESKQVRVRKNANLFAGNTGLRRGVETPDRPLCPSRDRSAYRSMSCGV